MFEVGWGWGNDSRQGDSGRGIRGRNPAGQPGWPARGWGGEGKVRAPAGPAGLRGTSQRSAGCTGTPLRFTVGSGEGVITADMMAAH